MKDFLPAVVAALLAEVERGELLWSTPDGHRGYGQDTAEGCTVTVVGAGTELVTRVAGVNLATLT